MQKRPQCLTSSNPRRQKRRKRDETSQDSIPKEDKRVLYKGDIGWRKWCSDVIESAVLPVEHLSLIFGYSALHCAIRYEWESKVDNWHWGEVASRPFDSDVEESSDDEDICEDMWDCPWCNPHTGKMPTLLELGGFNLYVCIDHQLRQK